MVFAQLPELSCFDARKQRKHVDTLAFETFHIWLYENISKSPRLWECPYKEIFWKFLVGDGMEKPMEASMRQHPKSPL
jgi:hypothetical protein